MARLEFGEFRGRAVAETPCGAITGTQVKGSFDCGCASRSRSTTFAQDDSALFIRVVYNR